jgi:hypothetical protein
MLYQIVDPKPTPVVLSDNLPPTPPPPATMAANRRREVSQIYLIFHSVIKSFYRTIQIIYPNMIIEI